MPGASGVVALCVASVASGDRQRGRCRHRRETDQARYQWRPNIAKRSLKKNFKNVMDRIDELKNITDELAFDASCNRAR